MQETGNMVVGWILQLREILAMAMLCFLLWHIVARLLPYLMKREDDRAAAAQKREDERAARDDERWSRGLEKLGDKLSEVIQETGKQKGEVVEKLDLTMHALLMKLEEMSRSRSRS